MDRDDVFMTVAVQVGDHQAIPARERDARRNFIVDDVLAPGDVFTIR